MDNVQSAAGNLNTKALQPLNKVLGVGIKAAAGLAVAALAGVTATIASGVGAAMDMEQQIADIASVMGLAADETEPLKKLIQSLGLDPKLKVSATEAADAIEMLGRNGLSMTEIMDGAARGTVLLANATNADFGTAADIATDAMALFNIKASDMKQAVDGIASVTTKSKFSINDYKLALAQAGGVASVVGVEFDDFNATIAAISPYFASGSDAGTSFKTMLQRLIPQSTDAEQVMGELGLMTTNYAEAAQALARGLGHDVEPSLGGVSMALEELGEKTGQGTINYGDFIAQFKENQFFDQATGAMKDMDEIVGLLNTAFGGLSEEQKNSALSTMFGTDAMRAAAAMAGMTQEEFLALKGTMGKTDAEEMAATRMDTLSGVMEILWGIIDTLKLQIGDAFLPVLRSMAEMFAEQATIHGPKLVEMFQQLADKLAVATEKFLPWVVTNLPLMIEQIPVVVANIKEFVTEFIRVAKEVFNAIAPVVDFVAGLTSLKGIVTTVGVLMGISALASVISFVGAIWGAVAAVGGLVLAFAPLLLPIAAVGLAIAGLKLAWDNNLGGIQEKAKAVFDWLKGVFDDFPGTIDGLKDEFNKLASGAMTRLSDGFTAGKDWARNAIDTALDHIKEADFGGMAQNFYDNASGAMTRIREGILAGKDWARNAIDTALDHIKGTDFGSMAQNFFDNASGAMTRLREGILDGKGWARNAIDVSLDYIKEANFGGMAQSFHDNAKAVITKLGEGFSAAQEWAKGEMNKVLSDISDNGAAYAAGAFAGRMYDSAKGVIGKFGEGLRASTLGTDTQAALDSMIKTVNNWSGGANTHLYGVARDAMWKLVDGIGSVNLGDNIWRNLDGVIKAVNEWSNGARTHIYTKASEIGTHLMEGLRDGISNMFGAVISKMGEVTNLLPQWLKNQLGIHSPSTVFFEIGTNIMQGLAQGLNDAMGLPQMAMEATAGNLTNSAVVNNNQSSVTNFNVNQQVTGGDGYDNIKMLSMLYTGA
jgi:hypothetical protein